MVVPRAAAAERTAWTGPSRPRGLSVLSRRTGRGRRMLRFVDHLAATGPRPYRGPVGGAAPSDMAAPHRSGSFAARTLPRAKGGTKLGPSLSSEATGGSALFC